MRIVKSSWLVHGIVAEKKKLCCKIRIVEIRLSQTICLLHVAWSIPSRKYRYESMYIRQSHKTRYDSGCAEEHVISTQHFTWVMNPRKWYQEIYRPIRDRLKTVGRVYGWCQKMIDIDSISCCCCTNTHHMQYPLIELWYVKLDAW